MITFRRTVKLGFVLICLCGLLGLFSQSAKAEDFTQWHYHADAAAQPQADNTYDAVYADFTHLLKSTFHTSGTLDENSIRVVLLKDGQPSAPVAFRFVKADDYDAATNAAGTLVFDVTATKDPASADYRVYFDTKANGSKLAFQISEDVPEAANMIWNNSFEILSQNYKGTNRYANAGENMARGWWGNVRSFMTKNIATSAHSGSHAIGIVTPKDKTHVSIAATPSSPGLRLEPGQSYLFSFWLKGESLTSRNPVTASIYWYDKEGKYLSRTNIQTNVDGQNDFDWTQTELYLTAPEKAYSCNVYLGTYSQTGLLTVDDVSISVAVPPLLQ